MASAMSIVLVNDSARRGPSVPRSQSDHDYRYGHRPGREGIGRPEKGAPRALIPRRRGAGRGRRGGRHVLRDVNPADGRGHRAVAGRRERGLDDRTVVIALVLDLHVPEAAHDAKREEEGRWDNGGAREWG